MEIYRGLVLAERSAGERGKFIDVLTEHNTVREIYVRGAKKNTSAGLSATQLFSYANFSIRKQQKGLYLDSAEPIRIFYRLRESLSRLSLAMYFSELVRLSVREHQTPEENCFVMRLMLNTLHYLENGERSEALLKSIFELRLMTELGMMPDLLMCRSCGVFYQNGSISPWKRAVFSVRTAVRRRICALRSCSVRRYCRRCGTFSLRTITGCISFNWDRKISGRWANAPSALSSTTCR